MNLTVKIKKNLATRGSRVLISHVEFSIETKWYFKVETEAFRISIGGSALSSEQMNPNGTRMLWHKLLQSINQSSSALSSGSTKSLYFSFSTILLIKAETIMDEQKKTSFVRVIWTIYIYQLVKFWSWKAPLSLSAVLGTEMDYTVLIFFLFE